MNTISNRDDTIQSTDIIERIKELWGIISDAEEKATTKADALDDPELVETRAEYEALSSLAEQCEGYGDWAYGELLIHESHFTDYVRDLLNDTGTLPAGLPWYISDAIDWDTVTRHVDQDYMDVDFDGQTYKMRA